MWELRASTPGKKIKYSFDTIFMYSIKALPTNTTRLRAAIKFYFFSLLYGWKKFQYCKTFDIKKKKKYIKILFILKIVSSSLYAYRTFCRLFLN